METMFGCNVKTPIRILAAMDDDNDDDDEDDDTRILGSMSSFVSENTCT